MRATRCVSAAALVFLFFANAASAVSLDPRGIGQALVYPYYTVNKGQDTLLSIVNAGDAGKVVEMRFHEAYNSRVVLQFVLFLSPHDVWTASLSSISEEGGALLKTSDTSCTAPAFPAAGLPLSSSDYDGTSVLPNDGGPTSITRTREGFFEFIAIDDIVPGSPTDLAIAHASGAAPACDTIPSSWLFEDTITPTGTIYGAAAIVNVGEGTFFPYNADAIAGFTVVPLNPYSDGGLGIGISLEDANSEEAVNGVATAYVPDERGRPIALDYAFGIDAVSAVFMADAIYNEYIVSPSLGANTDWVVTLPTKSFYTEPLYGTGVPAAPFESTFTDGVAPVSTSGTTWDREEGSLNFGACNSLCPPVTSVTLSYVVNVLPIDNRITQALVSNVFGSTLTPFAIPPFGDDGQIVLRLDAPTHELPGGIDIDGNEIALVGLPVTGFMAYNVINTNAQPGLLANYSGLFRHRSTTACTGDIDGCNASAPRAGE
jgi:hypothetical protein